MLGLALWAAAAGCAVPAGGPAGELGRVGSRLSWAGLTLGMSVAEAEQAVGESLDLRLLDDESALVPWHQAEIERAGRHVRLHFDDEAGERRLVQVFVPFEERHPLDPMVETLKERVPQLVYQPSIHAPEVTESEDRKPLYVLEDNPGHGVLVGPDEGLWITETEYLD